MNLLQFLDKGRLFIQKKSHIFAKFFNLVEEEVHVVGAGAGHSMNYHAEKIPE